MFRIMLLSVFLISLLGCVAEEEIDLTGPADAYQLRLIIGNADIEGELELQKRAGRDMDAQSEILEEGSFVLERDRSYPIQILVTDHLDQRADFINSDRVRLTSYGCLTIERESAQLLVTPNDSSQCLLPDTPMLMIGVAREDDSKLILNEYLFKVVDPIGSLPRS